MIHTPRLYCLCLLAAVTLTAQTQTDESQAASKSEKSRFWTYSQNRREFTRDLSTMPADVQAGYRLFRSKCGECHSLNRLLDKSDLSADEWQDIVFRMQDMASSQTSEAQSNSILKFVEWDDKHRPHTDKKAQP